MDRLFDFLIGIFAEIWPFGRVDPWETGLRVTSVPWFLDVFVSRRPGVPRLLILKPGTHWVFPLVHDLHTVPATEDLVSFPNQSLTTLDGYKLAASGCIKFQVVNIEQLYMKIQNYEESLTNLTMGLIAEFIADHGTADITVRSLRAGVRRKVKLAASRWGVRILDVIIHDLVDHKALRLMADVTSST